MILHLATNTMIQTRLTAVSGYKQTFATVTAEVPGTLQPIEDHDKSMGEGVFGRQFVFFCDGAVDIKEGDRLKDENSVIYRVRGGAVVRRTFGSIDYLKVICERI